MLEVKIMFTHETNGQDLAYIAYKCPKCNETIVSFQTLHQCYNCKTRVISGGLLINSSQYRIDYHTGRVADDGNVYV
jgi:hypothetical protein